jgi:hypothetical protein
VHGAVPNPCEQVNPFVQEVQPGDELRGAIEATNDEVAECASNMDGFKISKRGMIMFPCELSQEEHNAVGKMLVLDAKEIYRETSASGRCSSRSVEIARD